MFDFDMGKLLLIGVVALIFIPPKDLPEALRQIGRLVGKARRIAGEFQAQFNEAIRDAELDDLKNEFRHLKDQASAEMALKDFSELAETATIPQAAAKAAEGPAAGPQAPELAPPELAPPSGPELAREVAPPAAPELAPVPVPEPAPKPANVPPVSAGSHP
jgi:sec-independent protein translocase protein TatB